jgi:hypothetical protein
MINIEICKSYQEGRYNIRIGDIEGCTELSNATENDIINEIKQKIQEGNVR